MRRAITLTAAIAALALVVLAATPVSAQEGPPGFNGTVKIHDGNSESEPIRANEPHVGCSFHIHGFNFDGEADGTWSILSWPPTGEKVEVLNGAWSADDDGDWRTQLLSLESGHYRLNADQTDPRAPGAEKHKMFWVECEAAAGEAAGEEEEEDQGNQQEQDVAGVQQPPRGGVSPRVEGEEQAPGAPAGASRPPAVAGVQSLPSTSTDR